MNSIPESEPQKATPEDLEIARSIENISFLELKDKTILVLIWKKLKTASPISLLTEISDHEVKDLENIAKKAGMFLKPGKRIRKEMLDLRPGDLYFVANNEEDLELISKLWFGDHSKDPEVYKEIGRMSGFPATAIEVFDVIAQAPDEEEERKLRTELVFSPEEKRSMLSDEEYAFATFFIMSKKNWEEELEKCKEWARTVKELCPNLYEEIIKFRSRRVSK